METRELSVKLFLKTAWHLRHHCLAIIGGITLLAALITLFLPKKYVATATIMNVSDPQQMGSEGASVSRLLGLAGSSLNEGFFRFKAILNSRTFQEQVVESLGPDFFRPKKGWEGSTEALKQYGLGMVGKGIKVHIDPDQSNVLNLMVEVGEPEKAPAIANQTLVELQKYISQNSLTKAKRLTNYIADNIIETKAALFEMSIEMANFYKRHSVDPSKSKVENPLRQDMLALNSKNFDEISKDPLMKDGFNVLEEKKQKLLEKLKAVQAIPEQSYFGYLQEEYQILKDINLTLRQQYELAKLEAVRQEPTFQILDRAMGASYSGPNKRQLTFAGFILACIATGIYVMLQALYGIPYEQLSKEAISFNTRSILFPKWR